MQSLPLLCRLRQHTYVYMTAVVLAIFIYDNDALRIASNHKRCASRVVGFTLPVAVYDDVSETAAGVQTPTRSRIPFDKFSRSFIYYDEEDRVVPTVGSDEAAVPWSLSLLNADDLDEATDLIVECNYQSVLDRMNIDQDTLPAAVLNIFDDFIDKSLKQKLRTDVMNSFISRSYNRIVSPSTSFGKESLILIATEKETDFSRSFNSFEGYTTSSGDRSKEEKEQVRRRRRVVGVVEIYPTKEVYLCNLAVHQSHRRNGLGKILCEVCEEIALTEWGRQSIALQVDQFNLAAQRLYESMGYKRERSAVAAGGGWGVFSALERRLLGDAHLIDYHKQLLRAADADAFQDSRDSVDFTHSRVEYHRGSGRGSSREIGHRNSDSYEFNAKNKLHSAAATAATVAAGVGGSREVGDEPYVL